MTKGDLGRIMKEQKIGFLNEQELYTPTIEVLDAIKTVHQAGFLHNAISPKSILMSRQTKSGKNTLRLAGLSHCTPIGHSMKIDLELYSETERLYLAPEVLARNGGALSLSLIHI